MWNDTNLFVILFLGPVFVGCAIGYLMSLRKPEIEDLSWRIEPTLGTGPVEIPLEDHLGRKEPTF